MDIKKIAYELHQSGLSYKSIAKELNIGKTTAYDYVKEMKLKTKDEVNSPSDTRSEKSISSSEQLPEPSTEPVRNRVKEQSVPKETDPAPNSQTAPKSQPVKLKEFTGDELIKKKFDSLEFEGKFRELIGKPSRIFSAIIWGLPKGGKSNLSLRFADYLQEYFGKTIYIAAEEGESVTLQEKFKDIGGSKVTVVESRNRDEIRTYLQTSDASFVFIDSINTAGIDDEFLELLKEESPKKSFVAIVQATKGGNFKGDQALTHNCDFIIKVVEGVAYHTGRFNVASEIPIFEEPLYEKNPSATKISDEEPKPENPNVSTPKTISKPTISYPPVVETAAPITKTVLPRKAIATPPPPQLSPNQGAIN